MLHFIYFFSTNISTEYFKHAAHSSFSSSKCRLFHNATFFGSCIIHILHTGCAKIWMWNSIAKRLIIMKRSWDIWRSLHSTNMWYFRTDFYIYIYKQKTSSFDVSFMHSNTQFLKVSDRKVLPTGVRSWLGWYRKRFCLQIWSVIKPQIKKNKWCYVRIKTQG